MIKVWIAGSNGQIGRALNDILDPLEIEVLNTDLDDLDITKYPVYKRAQTGIGYLAQEASVFRQMSVEDNIAAVLEMTNKPKEYQKEKLESLIAEFRLQKDVVRREISELQHIGVEIRTKQLAGVDFTVDDLFAQGYDAIFMGTGTSLPRTLDIPGKELSGILTATYFLRMVVLADGGKLDASETLLHTGDNVIVVGAGNVAMDAARTSIRRGAKNVTIVYHKTEAEISAFPSEYEAAVAEGVQFRFLKQPIAYFNKKQMRALKNIRRQATAADETELAGLLLQNITKTETGEFIAEGGQELIPCDCVILAVGQKPAARIVSSTKGIQVDKQGFVITRDRPYGMTTRAGVFSSGDVVHGPATVVLAMKESKKVAAGIAQYVDAKKLLEDCTMDSTTL